MSKSTLITADGVRITIQPMPQSQCIMVWTHDKTTGKMQQLVVPLDMVGAFTVSCTAAAQSVARRGHIPMRCHDSDACKAGMAPCPTRQACGQGEAVELGVAL